MKRTIAVIFASIILCSVASAQLRPRVFGIAKMTFLVSDESVAKEYYGDFLGFRKAFSYPGPLGTIHSYKVNDHQFLEFIVDPAAREKDRFVSLSIETESVSGMVDFLRSKGVQVSSPSVDGAGNIVALTHDSYGNAVEFLEYAPSGLHSRDAGRHLGKKRISTRIHHAGLPSKGIDLEDSFWVKAFGGKVLFTVPDKIIYFGFVNSTESIENYYPSSPSFAHPCFLTEDMEETIRTLRSRGGADSVADPSIGVTGRWILNILNPDSTKVEFTEAHQNR